MKLIRELGKKKKIKPSYVFFSLSYYSNKLNYMVLLLLCRNSTNRLYLICEHNLLRIEIKSHNWAAVAAALAHHWPQCSQCNLKWKWDLSSHNDLDLFASRIIIVVCFQEIYHQMIYDVNLTCKIMSTVEIIYFASFKSPDRLGQTHKMSLFT